MCLCDGASYGKTEDMQITKTSDTDIDKFYLVPKLWFDWMDDAT